MSAKQICRRMSEGTAADSQGANCPTCSEVFELYGTTESVAPWLCICPESKPRRTIQQSKIAELCDCYRNKVCRAAHCIS